MVTRWICFFLLATISLPAIVAVGERHTHPPHAPERTDYDDADELYDDEPVELAEPLPNDSAFAQAQSAYPGQDLTPEEQKNFQTKNHMRGQLTAFAGIPAWAFVLTFVGSVLIVIGCFVLAEQYWERKQKQAS
jgi:hypothetical protein